MSNNPCSSVLIGPRVQKSVKSIKRLDENGQLYYMEYDGNYYGTIGTLFNLVGLVKSNGCSTFQTKNEKGEYLTGRNYDMPHLDDEKKCFGVNLVLHTKLKGKYQSIAGADSVWLSAIGLKVRPGCFDDGNTKLTGLALMPYLCMDGMNEKGLAVSILYLDIKEGEKAVYQAKTGKKTTILTILMRYMLDNCSDLDEAIELAKSYRIINTMGSDYHLFVSDAKGQSAVFEWRYNEFKVIKTDACTNFYVGSDDAEDCYYPDGLKEKWVVPDFSTKREYHFGYGHGYERFKKLIKVLDAHVTNEKTFETTMSKEESKELLSAVAQDYDGMLTSYTQYSSLYNHKTLEASYYLQQDYEKEYKFSLKENIE